MKKTARFLMMMAVGLFLSGQALAAKVSPMTVSGTTTVDTTKAKELFDKKVVFVDVRSSADWDAGRIPGAVHLEQKKMWNEAALAKAVGKDKPVVIYCNGETCLRSSECSVDAVKWGFKQVYYYRDGFPAWKKAGHPTE